MTTEPAPDYPEVDDPRVLALAKARQQRAHNSVFNAGFCPPWEALTEQEQRLGLLDARNYLRAAIDAGLMPTPAVPAGRDALRDRIAEALRESCMTEEEAVGPMTDAVLAVLPQPVDRATVLREAAEDLATAFGDPMAKHIGILGASYLRRRAREAEAAQTTEAQTEAEPETPLEKRLRYSERRNDELRTECLRRGRKLLGQSEKIIALEQQLDEVRTQLGAEILRAGQAEGELRRLADESQQQTERPRCPLCQMPHDLTPGSMGARACESIRARIIEAGSRHAGGDHGGCAAVDCETVRARSAEAQQTEPCRNCHGSGLDPRYNGEYACPDCPADAADQPAVVAAVAGEVRCIDSSVLRKPHGPHGWEPQPGMTPVRCPGFCSCKHPADEHSVYGCADGCGCEHTPTPTAASQPGKEA